LAIHYPACRQQYPITAAGGRLTCITKPLFWSGSMPRLDPITGLKVCSKKNCKLAGVPQPTSNFYKDRNRGDGLRCDCKACNNANSLAWIRNNKTRVSWSRARRKRPGVGGKFNISFEEWDRLCNAPCHYCGRPGPSGIDRVHNKVGYVPNNMVACCWDCNELKGNWPIERFAPTIRRIAKNWKWLNMKGGGHGQKQ